MRTLTLRLPDGAVEDPERVVALRGIAHERGTAAWERLKALPSGIDEAAAEAIAREALVQVRGERDASRP